jgi:methylmalonyl-CoA mutase N-terminal domain/subunit
MRLVTDMVEFCSRELPRWHPISISGYHIREARLERGPGLAFTLANGFALRRRGDRTGLDVDDFAPRLSFFFNAHLTSSRRSRSMGGAAHLGSELRDRYGAKNPRSRLMRFHTQTAGVSLTAQQPEGEHRPGPRSRLAAVLGGTQSLHTNSFDEALALPTENAVRSPRHPAGDRPRDRRREHDPARRVRHLEDPTNRLEAEAYDYFDRIEKLGGVIEAIKENFQQREIAEASFRYQAEVEAKQRIVVGVNRYRLENEPELELLRIDRGRSRSRSNGFRPYARAATARRSRRPWLASRKGRRARTPT